MYGCFILTKYCKRSSDMGSQVLSGHKLCKSDHIFDRMTIPKPKHELHTIHVQVSATVKKA